MIRLLTLLLFCIASTAAQAQTTFSFSGLAWGDSVDQVVAKLKAANLPPTSWTERLTCRVRSDCTLRFEGAVSGIAEFKGNGLSFVWIFSTSDAAAVEARAA